MLRHLVIGAAIVVWSLAPFAASQASAQSPDSLPRLTKLLFLPAESGASIPPPVVTEPLDVAAEGPASGDSPAVTQPNPIVAPQVPVESVRPAFAAQRSHSLMPLYVSTAALQVLDVHSTLQVLRQGGGEGNPMLQGLARNEGAFIAAKAAIAAGSLYAASRIAKRNKVGAVIMLLGINSAYAMVVTHNYRLAQQMR